MVSGSDLLAEGFEAPPVSAKPHVWWHWVNGNVTQEGIDADLAWMSRIGIGGLQFFDVGFHAPALVERPLTYMSPQWQDAFRHTVQTADRLGLELTIASSPGWSHTGGPWVKPQHAIKKLVWSEQPVLGGRPFTGRLPKPPAVTGPFQGVAIDDRFDPSAARTGQEFYADSVILAYRRPKAEVPPVRAFTSSGPASLASFHDGDLSKGVVLPAAQRWIQLEYRKPRTVQAITLSTTSQGTTQWVKRLEASDDGVRFRLVAEIPATNFVQQTIAFRPATARHFRLTAMPAVATDSWWSYRVDNAAPGAVTSFPPWAPTAVAAPTYTVTELVLHSSARVHRFEEKAGFTLVPDYYAIPSPAAPAGSAVRKADVVDLTDRMTVRGTLRWTPPPGDWVVLRMGYSLTGKRNQPASPEATGLEVDKLSSNAVSRYAEHYLDLFSRTVGDKLIGGSGVRALLQDSIETGAMNWTEKMVEEFKRLRGYDPTPWLPALTGIVIESAAESDKFLWDFRRTIGQLLADHHYGEIAASARRRGMMVYAEALEDRRVHSLGDDMEMRKHADVPMGAMWTFQPQHEPWPSYVADIRGAASVAHVYGRPIVGAESFTTILNPWAFAPRDLKPIADLEFALGANRPVIHTSVHQPFMDRKPGLSLWIVGQYFNRNETWAEQARPWVDYLSRTSFLLQQGRFVADIAYFYGEEAPLTGLFADRPISDVPDGYGFDFVNADIVLNQLKVQDGLLVTPSGMRYRMLYLGGSSQRMTLAVLRRIDELVEAGATVVGDRPIGSPSLADDDVEFSRIADRLWRGRSARGVGRVVDGRDLQRAALTLGVAPDFEYTKPQRDSDVMFLHRTLGNGELYFLSNRRSRVERISASFRVNGYKPQIWRAVNGTREPLSYRIERGRTFVRLDMQPNDAFFVVFREPTASVAEALGEPATRIVASLAGSWDVSFEGDGAPAATVHIDRLATLTVHEDPAIRYFSGTSIYRKHFAAPRDWVRHRRLWLDLGEVGDLAEIIMNGRSVGTSLFTPNRLDVTKYLQPGRNELEIRVTNLWVNRLIGDARKQVPPVTFTTVRTYEADAPLRPAGLIGPVTIVAETDSTQ